jgi:hypothetical protein
MSVLVGGAVEATPGLEPGEAGSLAGGDPAVERAERPVQAGQGARATVTP